MFPDEIATFGQVLIVPLDDGTFRVDSVVYKKVNGRIIEFRNSMGEVQTYAQAVKIKQTWFGMD